MERQHTPTNTQQSASADVLAIDIGGTKIACGLVAHDGTVREQARTRTAAADGESLFAQLERLCRDVTAGRPILGVGAGCGGPMRFPDGVVSPLHIPQWREFPLRERLERAFGVRAVVDNDAKAFALGEWWLGAGRGSRSMLGMVVSTGVGGGLIVDGRLLDGAHGQAGHVGHVIVADDPGLSCSCGARGCLTSLASGTGIKRRVADAVGRGAPTTLRPGATAEDVAHAARAGDELARTLFSDAGAALARGVASVAALLDLDRAVLGGSIALRAWDLLAPSFERELGLRLSPRFAAGARVERAALADRAGIVGAAALVLRPT